MNFIDNSIMSLEMHVFPYMYLYYFHVSVHILKIEYLVICMWLDFLCKKSL